MGLALYGKRVPELEEKINNVINFCIKESLEKADILEGMRDNVTS